MRKKSETKLPAFIALFCILVYAGAVLFGAFRIYTSIKDRLQRGSRELDGIQSLIVQNSSEFFNEPFRERVRTELGECAALEGIIITGSMSPLAFEKKTGTVINWNPTPAFIPRFGIWRQTRQADTVTIHALINAVNYEDTIHALRQTLLAILAALFISFLTMIITLLRSRNSPVSDTESPRPEYSAPRQEEAGEDFFDDFSVPETETSVTNDFNDDFNSDTFSDDTFGGGSYNDSTLNDDTLNDNVNDDDFELPDFDAFASQSDEQTVNDTDDGFHLDDFLDEDDLKLPESADLETVDVPEKTGSEKTHGSESPSGLYSPRSNIGWEAYTQDRLASELHRCAASEQDLVVLLMECGEGVNCDGRLYKKIADEAVDLFNLHDLSFEYGDRGITVIIPNAGLEQGMAKAEEFHTRLLKSCFDSFHSRNDFLIGISSRSGRLIEADRLLMEAKRALEKATIDAGPIVAFKSDPEKYREFVRKNP